MYDNYPNFRGIGGGAESEATEETRKEGPEDEDHEEKKTNTPTIKEDDAEDAPRTSASCEGEELMDHLEEAVNSFVMQKKQGRKKKRSMANERILEELHMEVL